MKEFHSDKKMVINKKFNIKNDIKNYLIEEINKCDEELKNKYISKFIKNYKQSNNLITKFNEYNNNVSQYLEESGNILDNAIYGQKEAKTK